MVGEPEPQVVKVLKAHLIIKDEVHNICLMDVIEYEGGFWLVPEWLDYPALKATRPLRIVAMETLVHTRTEGRNPEFVVEYPVPKYVFDGRIPPEEAGKYIVIENPDVAFRRDESLN